NWRDSGFQARCSSSRPEFLGRGGDDFIDQGKSARPVLGSVRKGSLPEAEIQAVNAIRSANPELPKLGLQRKKCWRSVRTLAKIGQINAGLRGAIQPTNAN